MGFCWTSSQILFSSFRAWDTWVLYVSTIVGVPSVCVLVRLFLYRTVCLSLKRTRLISGFMTVCLYPLDRRAFWTLSICLRKLVLSVLVRRDLYDSPRAMLFSIPGG